MMFLRTAEMAFARYQARGDPRALAIAFDRTAKELLRLARHLAGNEADAEDLVQGTWLTAIESARTWRRELPLLPWLCGILANHARQTRRRQRRLPDPARLRPDDVVDVHDDAAANELHERLRLAIAGLPEAYRPVLRLWFEHGLAANEIAAALERPAGTVRAQVTRGLELLRRALPASIAGGAAVAVASGRGIAAVRQHVLAGAPGTAGGAGSTLVIGGLMLLHHKLLATALAAAFAMAFWFLPGLRGDAPADAPPPPSGAAVAVTVVAPGAEETTPPGAAGERTAATTPAPADESGAAAAPPAATGSLLVVVRRRSDHAPAAGVGISVRPARSLGDPACVPTFVDTDAHGRARFAAVAAGDWSIDVDRLGNVQVLRVDGGRQAEAVVELPDAARVRGVVVDADGNPVGDAEVVLHASRLSAPRVATSDRDGRFTVDHVDRVELQARKRGFAPSLAHPVQARPGDVVELRLQLGRGGRRLAGTMRSTDGEPVAGAAIAVLPAAATALTPWDRGKPQPRPVWLQTDANGAFACEEVGMGSFRVVGRSPVADDPPAWADADTTASDALVDLRVAPATVIEGSVKKDGVPVTGVQVLAFPEQPEASLGYLVNLLGLRTTMVGADGSFRLVGTLPGEVVLRATRGLQMLGESRHTLASGGRVRWDLELGAAVDLQVHVQAGSALPATTMVLVRRREAANEAPAMAPLGRDGRATLQMAARGPVDVEIVVMRGKDWIMLARLEQHDPARGAAVFGLRDEQLPRTTLRGRLVDGERRPRSGDTLWVRSDGKTGLFSMLETTVGADGGFTLGPLPAGGYQLLTGAMSSPVAICTVEVASPGEQDLGDLVHRARHD